MNRIPDVEVGDINGNHVRKIAREALNFERTQILLEQATESFDSGGNAAGFERDIGFNHFVHRNGMKIDVQNIPA